MKGIDVFDKNGEINWESVKNDGIDFCILQAGFGSDISQKDDRIDYNITEALKAGLHIGVYWFGYALSTDEARTEADLFTSIIAPYKDKIKLGCWYDWEYDSLRYMRDKGITLSKDEISDICIAFMERMKENGYYQVGNYTNLDFWNNYFNMDKLSTYPVWYAQYSAENSKNQSFWQYSSTGSVNGVNGNADMNVMPDDYFNLQPQEQPVYESESEPEDNDNVNVTYGVRINGNQVLPDVLNLSDYAGIQGQNITDIKISVDKGSVKYRVHNLNGDWLDWVTGADWSDINSYAGNGNIIDAIQVYYFSPDDMNPKKKAVYNVSPVNEDFWNRQWDTDTDEQQDGYAGSFGRAIDKIQINIQ